MNEIARIAQLLMMILMYAFLFDDDRYLVKIAIEMRVSGQAPFCLPLEVIISLDSTTPLYSVAEGVDLFLLVRWLITD